MPAADEPIPPRPADADPAQTDPGLMDRVSRWIDADPHPGDRAELRALLAEWPESAPELADRFAAPLRFGTAGLRGPLRAGPNGMNLAVVRTAAAGLVRWLERQQAPGPVVVGYDARHRSAEFAAETVRVVTGAGRSALLLPGPVPTPVLAYAVRRLAAAAGVMVTASHNPPADNGYKVYLGGELGGPGGAGAQLAPPADAAIEALIREVGPATEVPMGLPATPTGATLIDEYVAAAAELVDPAAARELTVAYTPLHGVGGAVFTAAMAAAGFPPPAVVPSQAAADPDFPTVAFPNPEEPGAMGALLAHATAVGAELAIAHDPDADRCAVAVPGSAGDWQLLTGDELGVLLADHLIRRGATGRYATTLVSSTMLRALCAARGVPYGETLTGFKWIVRAGDDLRYGYEEALGYCVAPQLVRDKDGITAGLLVCELAATLRETGRRLTDRLDDLAVECGVYATGQLSVRFDDLAGIGEAMARLRAAPPVSLLGRPVTGVEDRLPATDLLIVRGADCRLVVRPSGTEPKLKAYLEVVEPVADRSALPAARQAAAGRLRRLREQAATALGL